MSENLVYGLIGFIIGGIIGGIAMGSMCAKEYRGRIEALQSENMELHKQCHEQAEKAIIEREKAVAREEIRVPNYSQDDFKHSEQEDDHKEANAHETYMEFTKEYRSTQDDSDEQDDITIDIEPAPPRIIDEQTFFENLNYMDSEKLAYYQQDQLLVDMLNEEIENENDVIGAETIDYLNETRNDTIYVINELEDKLYEIMVNHNESIYRDIAGASL